MKKDIDRSTVHVQVIFKGHVQGVGFRFTVQRLASKYTVAGWVKNVHNGDVEVVAQGASSDVDMFLSAIREDFSSYIRDEEISYAPAIGSLSNFQIRF